MYSRNVRGPLELLKDQWVSEEEKVMKVCEWIEDLKDKEFVLNRDSSMKKKIRR